jgi:putative tricarboxylic transport membrane protein
MAFILANTLDTSLRQSLLMGDGSMSILLGRPISAGILVLALIIVGGQAYQYIRGSRGGIAPGEVTS